MAGSFLHRDAHPTRSILERVDPVLTRHVYRHHLVRSSPWQWQIAIVRAQPRRHPSRIEGVSRRDEAASGRESLPNEDQALSHDVIREGRDPEGSLFNRFSRDKEMLLEGASTDLFEEERDVDVTIGAELDFDASRGCVAGECRQSASSPTDHSRSVARALWTRSRSMFTIRDGIGPTRDFRGAIRQSAQKSRQRCSGH